MTDFVLTAELRNDMGKGASRRLRSTGMVPAILYGGHKDPTSITLIHNELVHQLSNEAFFSHILTVKLDGQDESAIVKDVQRHPSKPVILHIDLQRVSATENIRVHVPLHFINANIAPGVKESGGIVTHNLIEVEVQCLPKDLPEFIEVDLAKMANSWKCYMARAMTRPSRACTCRVPPRNRQKKRQAVKHLLHLLLANKSHCSRNLTGAGLVRAY